MQVHAQVNNKTLWLDIYIIPCKHIIIHFAIIIFQRAIDNSLKRHILHSSVNMFIIFQKVY